MGERIYDATGMSHFGADFVAALKRETAGATVIALSGELGAGKTTFAQAIARALDVEETVNSPTFVIQKVYALSGQKWKRLVHIDAYRLERAEELRQLGWDELVNDTANLIVIEWPERVAEAIPKSAHTIRIKINEGDERIITYGT